LPPTGCKHFSCIAGSGYEDREWKESIRGRLARTNTCLPDGPVEAHLAFRCSTSRGRNWANLWKYTGDSMGPILGCANPAKPYNPRDDRIVSLSLHWTRDETMGGNVEVGMWWKLA